MVCVRPDICFAVSYFRQFQKAATSKHFGYLLHVIKYLYSTRNIQLIFTKFNNVNLEGYTDADWSNNISDSKSISRYCFKVLGNLISWKSRKQPNVALSSTEAKLLSLSTVFCEAIYLKKLLEDFHIKVPTPIEIMEDNHATIKLLRIYRKNCRVKHLLINVDFVLDIYEKGLVDFKYVRSNNQLADTLTKSFPGGKILKLVCFDSALSHPSTVANCE